MSIEKKLRKIPNEFRKMIEQEVRFIEFFPTKATQRKYLNHYEILSDYARNLGYDISEYDERVKRAKAK